MLVWVFPASDSGLSAAIVFFKEDRLYEIYA